MDAVHVEHKFAGALGVGMGKRGHANDADIIRSGKLEYFLSTVTEAVPKLEIRIAKLSKNEKDLPWINSSIVDLKMLTGYLESAPEGARNPQAVLYYWHSAAALVDLLDGMLKNRGV